MTTDLIMRVNVRTTTTTTTTTQEKELDRGHIGQIGQKKIPQQLHRNPPPWVDSIPARGSFFCVTQRGCALVTNFRIEIGIVIMFRAKSRRQDNFFTPAPISEAPSRRQS